MIRWFKYWCDRCWRTLATGFCFAFFFLGALVISFTCFPVVYAWPGTLLQKRRRARVVVCSVFRFFVGMMEFFGLIEVRIFNRELLQESAGCIVIANHPTLIDVVILMALIPRANCVVKEALWQSNYLRWVMLATGFISNQNAEQLLESCRESLASGDALIIFPEGSRTVPGAGLDFKRGVAHITVRTGAPIMTVLITCKPTTLIKGEPWYRIPPSKAIISLRVQEILQPQTLVPRYDDKPAAARQLTRFLQEYYERNLEMTYD
jgi:1-acyl-sn-glycerol-3-phosphate acyltransferase